MEMSTRVLMLFFMTYTSRAQSTRLAWKISSPTWRVRSTEWHKYRLLTCDRRLRLDPRMRVVLSRSGYVDKPFQDWWEARMLCVVISQLLEHLREQRLHKWCLTLLARWPLLLSHFGILGLRCSSHPLHFSSHSCIFQMWSTTHFALVAWSFRNRVILMRGLSVALRP